MSIRDSFFDAKAVGALWDVAVSLKRGNPLPIDADSVFESEAKLVEYIGDKISTVAYPGQVVAVVNEASTEIFYIDQNLDYHAVGSKLTADGKSIKVDGEVLSLVGFDTADDGLLAQVKVDAEGNRTLNWVSIETIAQGDGNTTYAFTGLDSETSVSFEVKASDADAAVKIYLDAYSKSEIDAKVEELEGKIEAATYDDTALAGRVDTIEQDYAKKTDLPTIPENVSQFTNDAKYQTEDQVAATVGAAKTELQGKIDAIVVPTKVSDLTNDSGFQTAAQVETIVDTAIAEINHAVFEKVESVPAADAAVANVLYLVPNGEKLDIYALISDEMVLIDDTDADLSGYATDEELQAAVDRIAVLEGKPHLSTNDVNGLIESKLADYDTSDEVDGKVKEVTDALDAVEKKIDDHVADEASHWTEAEVEAVAGTVADAKLADYDTTSVVEGKIATAKQEAIDAATYDDEKVKADIAANAEAIADNAEAIATNVEAIAKNAEAISANTAAIETKATKASTLAGYGIEDAYTKTETNEEITRRITEINGGESAGEVKDQLDTYKEANDLRVLAIETTVGKAADGDIPASGLVAEVADIIGRLDKIDANAQANVIESVSINGLALEIVDKGVNIPAATADGFGLVKLSDEIGVDADGALEVKSINVNKLVQTDGDVLILDGGTADNLTVL